MNYKKTISHFKSSNRITNITYYIYEPICTIRGILQISHGMCEYIMRYEEYIDSMTSQGILVCGNDHIGHGRSIHSKDELGYFVAENGWESLVDDMKHLTDLIKLQYPTMPLFILGHSMGSFLLRAYMTRFGTELTGAIISGTGGFNPIAGFGELIIKRIIKKHGPFYRSKKFNQLVFYGYNKHIAKNSLFSWLTRDTSVVDNYTKDPKCNFIFTANGFANLIKVQRLTTAKCWSNTVPKHLPLLIISGDKDPVGNYGKGVKNTYQNLLKANVDDVTLKLYKNGRHEMLNELNRSEVYDDIMGWMTQYI